MYGCENWTVKKAKCRRIDAFELWFCRRLLRIPWTARRSNQSILKEISPGCSLEGLMLKLKLQYFGHLWEELTHWKRPWCWEGLGAGGKGDDRGWDGWMASPTRWTWVWVNSMSWWWTGRPGMLQFMGLQRVGHGWTTKLNWTELNMCHTLCSGYLEQAVSKPLLLLCVEVLSSTFLTLLTIFLLCPSPILVWFRSDWQSCYPIAIGMSRSLTLTCLQPHYSIRPASASSTEMSMRSSPGRSEFFPGNL